jgi:uncharacterized protein (DUF433 family)
MLRGGTTTVIVLVIGKLPCSWFVFVDRIKRRDRDGTTTVLVIVFGPRPPFGGTSTFREFSKRRNEAPNQPHKVGRNMRNSDLPLRHGWSKMATMDPDLDLSDLLTCTPQGTWRIAGTRVSLDSVIHSFWEGATPEEICQDFPSLSLAQAYGAIAYYLKQRDKVDAYLQAGRDGAEELQRELNGRHRDFLSKLRQQLLSSRASPTPS